MIRGRIKAKSILGWHPIHARVSAQVDGLEKAPLLWGWAALIKGLKAPYVGLADTVEVVIVEAFGPKRLTFFPAEHVVLPGDGRHVYDAPFLGFGQGIAGVLWVRQAPDQIIFVPACLDDDDRACLSHQPCLQHLCIPTPELLPDGRTIGLLPVLCGVVKEDHVGPAPGSAGPSP